MSQPCYTSAAISYNTNIGDFDITAPVVAGAVILLGFIVREVYRCCSNRMASKRASRQ